jgi:drug/metabolite transporter (DMT)-like permease
VLAPAAELENDHPFMPETAFPTAKTRQAAIQGLLGCLAVFASAFCFYFSTVVIRWSREVVDVDSAFFSFFRFLIGFIVVCAIMALKRQGPVARRYDLLIGRTVGNCIAVFCFYQAVRYTSLAEANILNMTYPIFIAILSWIVLRDQRDLVALAMVGVALVGVWLILQPGRMGLGINSLWGLGSGISAAVAIFYLNLSRRHHDANTVLFYMFGLGAILMFAFFRASIYWPNPTEFYYLALCGGSGIVGQFLITLGFRYVTAVEGGVISSTRILLAALLGPFLASDPSLGPAGWGGALLLFGANVVLAVRKGR